jgi:hypothetical protein
MNRPKILDSLPVVFLERIAPISGTRNGLANVALRAIFEENQNLSLPHPSLSKLLKKLDNFYTFEQNEKGICASFCDGTLIIGTLENDTITFFPWAFRTRLHCSPSLMAKMAHKHLCNITVPDFLTRKEDMDNLNLALASWLEFNTAWTYAKLPAWAQDRKEFEKNIRFALVASCLDRKEDVPSFTVTFQGSCIAEDGDLIWGGFYIGSGTLTSVQNERFKKAILTLEKEIKNIENPVWTLGVWASPNGKFTQMNVGSLMTVSNRGHAYTDVLNTSVHHKMNIYSMLPPSFVESLL